jgi:hypothetical protein
MTDDDSTEVYRYPFDRTVAPSKATYLAVAERLDCEPMELPQLGRAVDTDSIDALFDPTKPSQNIRLSFEYADCAVTITQAEVQVVVQ